ncbi:MAG TPA: hypothetical protein VMU20_00445, partial [Candidatus Dormibacteraeota bacterium]|nr:hypothetical protein [Candidatus Dormibacteraeota bacterium]
MPNSMSALLAGPITLEASSAPRGGAPRLSVVVVVVVVVLVGPGPPGAVVVVVDVGPVIVN